MSSPTWVPLTAAAMRCRVSWRTMLDLCLKGEVRAEKRAGRWFCLRADVDRLAQARAVADPQPAPTA